jgi:uncharacterized protein
MNRIARSFAQAFAAALLAFALAAGAAQAAPSFPALTGRVVDGAGILSQGAQDKLTALLAEHETQTGNQVVVVTVKSLQDYDVQDYGVQLGRAWGIGQKGKNNGVVVVVAPNEHKVGIETGYGMEGDLTDAQSKLIIENAMLPFFKKGDYDSGVLAGTVQVLQALGGKPTGIESIPQPESRSGGHGGIPIFVIIIILWVVFGRFLWPLFFLGGIFGGGGRGGGFGGGFGGGSFGGGGGFSGGGGSFGGGGASGSW